MTNSQSKMIDMDNLKYEYCREYRNKKQIKCRYNKAKELFDNIKQELKETDNPDYLKSKGILKDLKQKMTELADQFKTSVESTNHYRERIEYYGGKVPRRVGRCVGCIEYIILDNDVFAEHKTGVFYCCRCFYNSAIAGETIEIVS